MKFGHGTGRSDVANQKKLFTQLKNVAPQLLAVCIRPDMSLVLCFFLSASSIESRRWRCVVSAMHTCHGSIFCLLHCLCLGCLHCGFRSTCLFTSAWIWTPQSSNQSTMDECTRSRWIARLAALTCARCVRNFIVRSMDLSLIRLEGLRKEGRLIAFEF